MQIIDLDKEDVNVNIDSITLGNFDGMHFAHQRLIKKCIELGVSGVFLFKKHTLEQINNENFKYILSIEDKINILRKIGVKYCFIKSFDNKFLSLKPQDFLEYIKAKTNFKNLVVGKDFKFGIDASGDVQDLKNFSVEFGYKLHILEDQFINDVAIRSTTIRNYLLNGEIEKANSMLFRSYSINGVVIDGKHRGRNLGYPTANLKCSDYILPESSVYYTNIIYKNKLYKGITSIGKNLTYNENDVKIETHILNFSGDLYGKELVLIFLKKIRENRKFNSENDLIENLKNDYNYAENQILDLQLEKYMII